MDGWMVIKIEKVLCSTYCLYQRLILLSVLDSEFLLEDLKSEYKPERFPSLQLLCHQG